MAGLFLFIYLFSLFGFLGCVCVCVCVCVVTTGGCNRFSKGERHADKVWIIFDAPILGLVFFRSRQYWEVRLSSTLFWPQFLLAAPLEEPQASCPNHECFSLQLWGRSFWMTYQLLNRIFRSLSRQAGTFRLPGLLYFGIFWFGRSFFTICYQLSISLTDNVSCFLSVSFEALISSLLPSFCWEPSLGQALYKAMGIRQWMPVPVPEGWSFLLHSLVRVGTRAHPHPHTHTHMAAAAVRRFSRVRLCDPIDGSPPGSPVPGILQARVLEWGAIAFSNTHGRCYCKNMSTVLWEQRWGNY